jgi:putative cell wall-binding protein
MLLPGDILHTKKNAPILLVNGESDSSLRQAASYIEDSCEFTAFVYILGGTDAIPDYFTDYLPDKRVVRLGGNTRYETNLKILEEAGVNKEDILIADSTSFADSLSASAAKRPILLVGKKGLNNDQKNFLNAHKGNMHYILGGTNAISKSIEDAVRSYGTVSRINGSNRYETSLNIAKKFFPDSKSVVLAYGSKFPDGLSGGPLAVKMNAPLLLTKSGYEKYALDYCKSKDIHLGYVLGGDTMITSDIAKTILQIKY